MRAIAAAIFSVGIALAGCGDRVPLGSDSPLPPPPVCGGEPCGKPCPLGQCDGMGHCVYSVICRDPSCIGKQCGDPCWICPSDDPDCPAPADAGQPEDGEPSPICGPGARCVESTPEKICPPHA